MLAIHLVAANASVAPYWQATLSAVIAGLVGLAELLTRYRSDPWYALKQPAALLYVAVNAGAGFLALYLVRAFAWTFGQTSHVTLWRVLVAGFGAMAVFRSSLFVAKIGGNDVNVGPMVVIGALLDTFDRAVDRKSASEMSEVLEGTQLTGLDADAVMTVLPVLCLALMQNFSASDQALLAADIQKTRGDTTLSPEAKMQAVVVQLAKYLGVPLVKQVLTSARPVLVKPIGTEAALAVLAKTREIPADPNPPG